MSRWHFAALTLAALLVTACAEKKPEPAADQPQEPVAAKPNPVPVEADPYASDPYGPTSTPPQSMGSAPRKATPPANQGGERLVPGSGSHSGQRTHVVQRGDTLYKIARQYYNDQSKWKAVWEANRAVIHNKDQLEVGTRLVIP